MTRSKSTAGPGIDFMSEQRLRTQRGDVRTLWIHISGSSWTVTRIRPVYRVVTTGILEMARGQCLRTLVARTDPYFSGSSWTAPKSESECDSGLWIL